MANTKANEKSTRRNSTVGTGSGLRGRCRQGYGEAGSELRMKMPLARPFRFLVQCARARYHDQRASALSHRQRQTRSGDGEGLGRDAAQRFRLLRASTRRSLRSRRASSGSQTPGHRDPRGDHHRIRVHPLRPRGSQRVSGAGCGGDHSGRPMVCVQNTAMPCDDPHWGRRGASGLRVAAVPNPNAHIRWLTRANPSPSSIPASAA